MEAGFFSFAVKEWTTLCPVHGRVHGFLLGNGPAEPGSLGLDHWTVITVRGVNGCVAVNGS